MLGDYIKNEYYVPIYSNSSYNATGYNYASSISFAVNKDLEKLNLESYAPFKNQSDFVELSTNVNNVFERVKLIDVKDGKLTGIKKGENLEGNYFYQTINDSKRIIIDVDNLKHDNLYFYIGGDNITGFQVEDKYYSLTSDEYYVFDAGKFEKDSVSLTIKMKEDIDSGSIYLYAYTLNKDAFQNFYKKIKSESLVVTKYSDTLIEGNIHVSDDKVLFTSIAYDDGWSIYIDGKKVKTKKIMDTFLSCDIKKGKHEIKLVYYPKLMKEGLITSLISLILLIVYCTNDRQKNKKDKKDEFIV